MKRLALLLALVGCGATAEDPIEIEQGILIAIEPHRPTVTCELATPTSCNCAMSECTKEALVESTRQCNLLRGYGPKIIIE